MIRPWLEFALPPLLGLALLLPPEGRAQYEFSFTGYAVDLPVYQLTGMPLPGFTGAAGDHFLNITRLRLRPVLTLWENARLALEYEVNSLYHSAPLLNPLQAQEPRHQVATLTWQPVNDSHVSLLHFVDRLTLTQRIGFADVTLGRQRIAWGTGRIWNPTDLFNPINPTSFAKIEKDGVDAVSLTCNIANFTDAMLVWNPQRGQRSNAGFRLRSNFSEFDVALVGGYFDERTAIGADVAGNLMTAGVRWEGLVSAASGDLRSSFAKWILGMDYQFTSTLYALVEYHHNGEGSTDRKSYDLSRLVKGEILNVAREYVALGGSYLPHPLVTASATVIGNLNDGSRIVNLTISYSAGEDWTLAVGSQLFAGHEMDEYWYYPDSYFFRADAYF